MLMYANILSGQTSKLTTKQILAPAAELTAQLRATFPNLVIPVEPGWIEFEDEMQPIVYTWMLTSPVDGSFVFEISYNPYHVYLPWIVRRGDVACTGGTLQELQLKTLNDLHQYMLNAQVVLTALEQNNMGT